MFFRSLTVTLFSIHSSLIVHGQNTGIRDSLTIEIVVKNAIRTNNDLQAKIIVKNVSIAPVSVYRDLQYGDFIGNQLVFNRTNFAFLLEEKKGDKFVANAGRSRIDFAPPGGDTLDDREKIILVPHDSIIYSFQLDGISGFKAGSHRLKCFYTNHFQATKGISSNWYYFQVLHEIYPKHDYLSN